MVWQGGGEMGNNAVIPLIALLAEQFERDDMMITFTPAKDYNGLLKQAKAMTKLIQSMEKQRTLQHEEIRKMACELRMNGVKEINAQRDTNAILSDEIEKLQLKLEEYENPKNWTRPFDWNGKLINEHALYKPKLSGEKR